MFFRPIIALWGAEDAARNLSSDVGLPPKNVRRWVDFDSIPADWFTAVAKAAQRRGFKDVTVERLAQIAEDRRLARSGSAGTNQDAAA